MTTHLHEANEALTTAGKRRLHQRLERSRAELADLDALIKAGDASDDHVRLRQELDEHAAELDRLLTRALDIADVEENPSIVEVGDEVDVEFDDGGISTYALVHPAEVSVGENRISAASPLGHALLGRGVGERIEVEAPAGVYTCTVRGRRRLA